MATYARRDTLDSSPWLDAALLDSIITTTRKAIPI